MTPSFGSGFGGGSDDDHNENRFAPPGFRTSTNTDKREAAPAQDQAQAVEIDQSKRTLTDAEARLQGERIVYNETEARPGDHAATLDMNKLPQADVDAIIRARGEVYKEKAAQEENALQHVAAGLTSEKIKAAEEFGQSVKHADGQLQFRVNEQGQFVGRHVEGSKEHDVNLGRVKELVTEREATEKAAQDQRHDVVSQTFTSDQMSDMKNGKTVSRGDEAWKIEGSKLIGRNAEGGEARYDAATVSEKVDAREAIQNERLNQQYSAQVKAAVAAKQEKEANAEHVKGAAYDLSSKNLADMDKGQKVNANGFEYAKQGDKITASVKGGDPAQAVKLDAADVKAGVEKRERATNQFAAQITPAGIAALEKGKTINVKGIECEKRGDAIHATGKNGTTHVLKMDEVKAKVATTELTKAHNKSDERTNAIKNAAATSQEASASKKVNAEPTKVERLRDMPEGTKITEKSGNSYKFDHKTNELVRFDPNGKETGRKPLEEVAEAERKWQAQQKADEAQKSKENAKANENANGKAKSNAPAGNKNVDGDEKKQTTKERRKAAMSPERADQVNAIKAAAKEGKQKSAQKGAAKDAEPTKAANEKKKEDELAK